MGRETREVSENSNEEFFSLRGLYEVLANLPMPSLISLEVLRGMTYSDEPSRIWEGGRNANSRRNYLPNKDYTFVQGRRYSRRMNQGARD